MSLSSLKASRVRLLLALGLVTSALGAATVSWLVARAQSVGAGQSHSAVLKTGGTIAIWGYNGYGQLGDGTNTQRNVPVELSGTYELSLGDPSCAAPDPGQVRDGSIRSSPDRL